MNPRRRNLPLALLHAREAAMGYFRPILKRNGLTDQQWRVVRVLSETAEPLEPGQIADACKILGPSLTGILRRLDEMQLVRREWSPVDQRRQLVTLTAKGRALVDRMTPLIDQQYALIEAAFGKEKLDAIYETLDRMTGLLEREIPSVVADASRPARSARHPLAEGEGGTRAKRGRARGRRGEPLTSLGR
ncbi:MAG TPA: homoprotocatechuate degradation operon regulator HpaR [Alphaproteobacteria bacterium]|jgi:homoprotocatechuate degradation regulator HpaR